MGESNGSWGQLAEADNDLAYEWDKYAPLPDRGASAALDAFTDSKRITIGDLVRVGARWDGETTLVFAAPSALKFRDIVGGRRWNYIGSEFPEMKIVRSGSAQSEILIIAEGETDAARLSGHYPCDVAIMQAGALYFTDRYAAQLAGYERVLVGLDPDTAGQKGWDKIKELVPKAERFVPIGGDWCEAKVMPTIPPAPERTVADEFIVSAGDMMTLEVPEQESWFEDALLPVSGQMVIHGWAKSFKSFLGLDVMAALAQGQPWAGFESTAGPCKVAVLQFEIVWAYYRKRIELLRAAAVDRDLFDQNFHTVTPLRRPPLVAGDTKQEDYLIEQLLDSGIEVVLIDPIRRALGAVNLNASEDVRPLLAYAQRLQDAAITVVLCHHDNKASARAGGGDPLSMTGAGDFAGDCDSIVSVAVPKGLTMRDPMRNLYFTLRNAPSPSPRGFAMGETAHIAYQPEPYGDGMDEDASGGPSI